MIVIAHKINKEKNRRLHWDFMRETCKSFDATLLSKDDVTLPDSGINVVALMHDRGMLLDEISSDQLIKIDTVLIGCDDNHNNWMIPYRAVRIQTPVDYDLWSGVALGVFLYQYNLEKISSC